MGQAGLKKKTGLGMPALIIGANIPDIDAACFFWLEGAEHLGFRRGITHGPIALLILPLLLAGLLWIYDRWQAKRGTRPEKRLPVDFGWLLALSFLGCISHPLLDWLNVYGVRFWEPFAPSWSYGDTLFIIDVWLWALFITTTWLSIRNERRGGNWQRPAWIGILVGTAYIGVNWMITTSLEVSDGDVHIPGRVVIASPMPIWSWKREMIVGQNGRYTITDPAYAHLNPFTKERHTHDRFFEVVGECDLEPIFDGAKGNAEAEAFLFWSRTPFGQRAADGSVILRDARFYDPRARDRFSVLLPDVECKELLMD